MDEFDRVRAPGILRNAGVGVIDIAVVIEHNVLEHCAETQCLKNVRLALGRKINRLRVTAAFNVKNAIVTPDMLVIADEMTFRVGRERRFARSTKTEEQR